MPKGQDSSQPDSQSDSQPMPSNRAARRHQGKDAPTTQAYGKVHDTSRRNPVQGPRRWSARRGG